MALKDKIVYFVIVRQFCIQTRQAIMIWFLYQTMKAHAAKFEAKTCYAGVGLGTWERLQKNRQLKMNLTDWCIKAFKKFYESCFFLIVLFYSSSGVEKGPQLMVLQGQCFWNYVQYSVPLLKTILMQKKGIDSVLAAVNESVSTYL